MKNIFLTLASSLFLLAAATSCKKDEVQAVLTPSGTPTLTASTATPVLTIATVDKPAVTYTWTAANFGYQAGATYTVQFDKKGGSFASPVTYPGGTGAGTLTLTVSQLSKVFTDLGLPTGTASQVDARLVVSVAPATGTNNSALTQQASAVTTVTATPIPQCVTTTDSWGIVGPAGDGWPGTTNTDRVMTYDCYSQTYSLTTALNVGEFKFRANKDWGTNLGGAVTGTTTAAALTLNGPNLQITTAGTYTVTLAVKADATGAVSGGTVTVK